MGFGISLPVIFQKNIFLMSCVFKSLTLLDFDVWTLEVPGCEADVVLCSILRTLMFPFVQLTLQLLPSWKVACQKLFGLKMVSVYFYTFCVKNKKGKHSSRLWMVGLGEGGLNQSPGFRIETVCYFKNNML